MMNLMPCNNNTTYKCKKGNCTCSLQWMLWPKSIEKPDDIEYEYNDLKLISKYITSPRKMNYNDDDNTKFN